MPVKVLRVINGQAIMAMVSGEQKILQIARICTPFPDTIGWMNFSEKARQYISDMTLGREVRIEFDAKGHAEVYFVAIGSDDELNLSDQMIKSGLAFPSA